MRIMHIGDLHIGRTLNQQSFHEMQKALLNQLVDEIDKKAIDILVIAGDIYDRSVPSSESISIFESFITEVNLKRRIPVLAISGNHDGAERLGYGKSYFKEQHFYMSVNIQDCFNPVSFKGVNFYLIPYIEPVEARIYFEDDSIRSHHDAYQAITNKINAQKKDDEMNIIVSHLFISGGEASDSERPLQIGGSEEVSHLVFEGFDYVLLGHLHHPFAFNSDTIFYSGSLMRYSFSEVNQPKGFRLIDINKKECLFIPLTFDKHLSTASGTYDDAINEKLNIKNKHDYLKLELTDLGFVKDPMSKLKRIYPNLLEIKPVYTASEYVNESVNVTELSEMDIIQNFYKEMNDSHMNDEQIEMIQKLLKEAGELNEA